MKKITKTILASSALLFAFAVNAQTETADVTLNVKLKGIHTITVNPAQTTVDLVYDTEAKYAAGVKLLQEDHLEIFSTGGFQVTASSSVDDIDNTVANGSHGSIAANTITISALEGTTKPITSSPKPSYSTGVALSKTGSTIVSYNKGAARKGINIEYGGGDSYLDYYVKDQGTSIYQTTVTYTLTAQ
ncbi:hypothetical protein [Arenibacter amylolyticus]|uniref:hypothetical protein n=1 Tax=Arenibacter amylolyticus TaxID=1406873 RepID=UPI000A3BE8E6|nr:hypothetical protein [Arenibacter amylolyticus]